MMNCFVEFAACLGRLIVCAWTVVSLTCDLLLLEILINLEGDGWD